ncbi:MAG: hypothetical protein HY703_11855 [Gemmatimonadetes bacterium]|nr:hypothetical protein [Gemmatimonadota bacterium]
MLRHTEELADVDRRYARQVLAGLDYRAALAHFTALWMEARRLNPEFPTAWLRALDADLELARVLNGLPRRS